MDYDIITSITHYKTEGTLNYYIDFAGPGPWATFYRGINLESDIFQLEHWDQVDLSKQLYIDNLTAITDLIIEGNLIKERLKEDGLVH